MVKLERVAFYVLLVLSVWLFVAQCRSLFIYPVHDSVLWYSDESWLMREAETQVREGVLRFPEAKGTVLEHSVGPLLGVSWTSSILYGAPILVFASILHPIDIGRLVTVLIALICLLSVYFGLKRLGASSLLSLAASSFILSSKIFFTASHSARSDVLVGCIALALFTYFAVVRRNSLQEQSLKWWFVFGLALSLIGWSVSPHLVVLIFPLALTVMIERRAFNNFAYTVSAIAGALFGVVLLALSYYIPLGFGDAARAGVVQGSAGESLWHSIPLVRFYSRSVQLSNIKEHIASFYSDAPFVLMIATVAFLLLIASLKKIKQDTLLRWDFISLASMLFGWLMLQSFGRTYMVHALPLIVFGGLLLIRRLSNQQNLVSKLAGFMAIIAIIIGIDQAAIAYSNSTKLEMMSETGFGKLRAKLRSIPKQSRTVVAEVPAFAQLMDNDSITLISDFFTAWSKEDLRLVLKLEKVEYAVLLRSSTLPRPSYSLHEIADTNSNLIFRSIGRFYDSQFDYFSDHNSYDRDTLEFVHFKDF